MLKSFKTRNFKFNIVLFTSFALAYYVIFQNKQYVPSNYNPICIIPDLKLTGHHLTISEPKCILKEDWGYLVNNTWIFIPSIKEKLNEFICEYRAIIRYSDDSKYIFSKWINLAHNSLILDEVIEVKCSKSKNKQQVYNNLFVQIVNKIKFTKQFLKKDDSKCKPMNIILLSYDSVSRTSWLRRLPKTNKFIFKNMNFELLAGYNIIGDGTPAALIPIYSGKTEEESPNVLKNSPNAKYVDEAYNFIWKELHKKNYMSLHLEDWPHIGAFNYRMKGFSNQTCHHYFKHYQRRLLEMTSLLKLPKSRLNDYCMGAKKRHRILLDLMLQFQREYNSVANNLAIMHYVENSHNSNERLNWVDNDLYTFLSTGYNEGLFDNTAIFLYSDHGARFADKRSPNNRYLEERLPFFAIHLPKEYKKNNPDKYNNLKMNSKLLTSPFDIYATVRDLTCLEPVLSNSNYPNRSISLLSKISPERNCEQIGLSEHFCTCVQNWSYHPVYKNDVISAVLFTLNSINKIAKKANELCVELNLGQIISAEILNRDNNQIYKIQFIASPNKGVYETMLINKAVDDYEFISDQFSIKSRNDISRIDSYGEQPWCVSDFSRNPEGLLDIRKFCYCRRAIIYPKRVNSGKIGYKVLRKPLIARG